MTNSNAELHQRGIEAAYAVAKDYLAEVTSREQQMVRCCIRAYLAIAPQAPVSAVPVAWLLEGDGWGKDVMLSEREANERKERIHRTWNIAVTPLYAPPPPSPVDADATIERCAHVAAERSAELSLKAQDVRYGDSDRRYYSASAYDMQLLSHDILALKSSPPAQADDGKDAEIERLETELDHFYGLCVDDPGKNPPLFWKDVAAEQKTLIRELVAALEATRPVLSLRQRVDESNFGKGCSPATPILAQIDAALTRAKAAGFEP